MLWLIIVAIMLIVPLLLFAGVVLWLILSPKTNDSPFHPHIKGYPKARRDE